MKVDNHLLVIGIAVLLICVGLSGCFDGIGNSEKDRFVGTWKSDNIPSGHTLTGFTYFDFFSDGTYTAGLVSGTWEIKDGKLVLSMMGGEMVLAFDYSFSNSDQNLAIISPSGDTATYTKQ